MCKYKRGDLFIADLNPVVGSEQGGQRPVVILSDDYFNKSCSTVIIAVITGNKNKSKYVTHICVSECGLFKESIIMLAQIRTIDKSRIVKYIGSLDDATKGKVNGAIMKSLGLKTNRME